MGIRGTLVKQLRPDSPGREQCLAVVVREAGDQRPGVGCHTQWMQAGFLRCVEPRYGLLYQLTAAGVTVPSAGTNECFVASFGLT